MRFGFKMTDIPLILVADDDPDILVITKLRLKASGFEVISAEDGEEVLVKVDEHRPDLLLLDNMMPVMDGYETCSKLRSDPIHADLPIIIFSAGDREVSARTASQVGATSYIAKPFNAKDLLSTISDALQTAI